MVYLQIPHVSHLVSFLYFCVINRHFHFEFNAFTFQSDMFKENEIGEEEERCYGKRCTANEHCCPNSVCVDVDGGK